MSQDFKKLKIGYYPHNATLQHPGDRRRFVFFANEVGMQFEIADSKKVYDIVYLTSSCNVSEWIKYKMRNPKTKLIFEIIDSYLLVNRNYLRFLKGPYRYLTGKDDKFYLNYNDAFIEIIKISYAVVCSTPLLKEHIESYNSNVHISLDYFENEITTRKQNYALGDRIKLVWEGQSYTLENILVLKDTLRRLKDKIELHIITDKIIKGPFKFLDMQSEKLLDTIGIPYHFHEWDRKTFCDLSAMADLAVIPLNRKKDIMWNKPENKLLFFWQIGLPVITSPSPAYERVMKNAGIEMLADSADEWEQKIIQLLHADKQEIAKLFGKINDYLSQNHSKEKLMQDWRKIFDI
jgi:hypothetical protein